MLVLGVEQSNSFIRIHTSILFQILFPHRFLQNIEYSSLCYTIDPHCLTILYIVVCILEKEIAAHFSILAWRILWIEEPGGLLSTGSHRVRHDWGDLACMYSCIGEGNGNPLQCSCLENPRDGEDWWAAVYGVARSQIWLKQLSSSSSSAHMFIPNS